MPLHALARICLRREFNTKKRDKITTGPSPSLIEIDQTLCNTLHHGVSAHNAT
jgi:hypothetical protein